MKWGHRVYSHEGPVLLVRAEEERVLSGSWRGQRVAEIEPLLRARGKHEMATVVLREGESLKASTTRRLAKEASELIEGFGDPTAATKRGPGTTRRPSRWR